MRNVRWMAYLLYLIFSLLSCSETEDVFDTAASSQVSPIGINSFDVGTSYYLTDDGALHFKSIDDYRTLSDSLRGLPEDEFEAWETEVGFSSYRSLFKGILLSAMDMEVGVRNSFVDSNSDYVYIDSNDLIQPVVEAQFFQNVINKDRIFYIADNKYIIDNDFVITENQQSRSITNKIQYSLIDKSVSTKAAGDEVNYPSIEYKNVNGTYKVITWFKIYKNVFNSPFTGKFNEVILEVSVRPREFSKIAGFKDYNAWCYVEEMKIHMPGLGFGLFFDETGSQVMANDQRMYLHTTSSSNKTPLYTSSYVIWSSQTQEFGRLQDPVCVHYRARTAELGKFGAAYNTYHPLSGMDPNDCGHRLVTTYQNVEY